MPGRDVIEEKQRKCEKTHRRRLAWSVNDPGAVDESSSAYEIMKEAS